MKQASVFEIMMARCWNLLNESKTFTPIFTMGVFLLYYASEVHIASLWIAVLAVLPTMALYYYFDFPLWLRWFLLVPLAVGIVLFGVPEPVLLLAAFGWYAFFTVFFWGTLYYHLRIGTTWLNFLRIWKLFLKNSDSTSGNVFEQLPKVFLQLILMSAVYRAVEAEQAVNWLALAGFYIGLALFAWVVHRCFFTWKPVQYATYADPSTLPRQALADRVVVVVIDGCRKERLEQADAPFLHQLMQGGMVYDRMETIYPARTVTCFSSMFTGTYPSEHGIKSNMVWNLGVKVESIFDVLKKQGKKGVLFGCAHLIDAFGNYVQSFTAVNHNDKVDKLIIEQAKTIYEREQPELFIVQMIAVDQTGHSRGVHYPEYAQKIHEADRLIADFHQWLTEQGWMENTAFVIMADHGQGDGIGGHGHLDVGERFVPFIMNGPMFRQGIRVPELRSITSLAATISALLGLPLPAHARGPVLSEAFTESQGE